MLCLEFWQGFFSKIVFEFGMAQQIPWRIVMPAIVEIPQIVQQGCQRFDEIFLNQPQRDHLAEYVTGLITAQHKTVSGIASEFVDTTDQSCLNRFLTEAEWDEKELNEQRLQMLQADPSTRYHGTGVIAIDDVLIDHDGKMIQDVGWFWDHSEDRHKIAHDLLFSNYVCPGGKHYPLDFRRFVKRDQCQANDQPFQDHGVLFRQLIDQVCEQEIPGTFTFDSYFTNAENLNHIHGQRNERGESRGYVGDLKTNRKLEIRGRAIGASEFAASIEREQKQEIRRGDDRQWYYTTTVRLPQVSHPVRIVILWRNRRDQQPAKILVTNRVRWEINCILKTYRQRWTGTETFHRDGKQNLGMGDCQLRSGQGQTRHMYLVMLAYSLLMLQLQRADAKPWALTRLTTIGQACRAVANETLRTTLQWAMTKVQENSKIPQHVIAQLGLI